MSGQKRMTIVALVVLVILALCVGAYLLLYAPILEEKALADQRAAEIEAENDQALKELKDLAKQQEELPAKLEALALARQDFPTGAELAQFTDYLSALIAESGASIVSVSAQPPIEVTASTPLPPGPNEYPAPPVPQPPSGLYQYPFVIEVDGSWPQAHAYLDLLQQPGARLFLVTEVSAATKDNVPTTTDDNGTFQFTITGYTYALVPPDQIPKPADEAGESDG